MNNSEKPLTSSLDLYKLTMGDMIFHEQPDAQVRFTFENRGLKKGQRIRDLVSIAELRDRLDAVRDKSFTADEITMLGQLKNQQDGGPLLTPAYRTFLHDLRLPEVEVGADPHTGEITAFAEDDWARSSLWETIIMSEIRELHAEKSMEQIGLKRSDVQNEFDQHLTDIIQLLKKHPRTIRFAEFGTRRRVGLDLQRHALERFADEAPENLIGTSNPWLAHQLGLRAIGTYAHELPMVYGGLYRLSGRDPLQGEHEMLTRWEQFHRGGLQIALPDTFTSDSFFAGWSRQQAETWKGYRQDSGNPLRFARIVLAMLQQYGIDPQKKSILFSDSLSFQKAIDIDNQIGDQIPHDYGIGGEITNKVHRALPPVNIVVKATHVNGQPNVKLSDETSKHTGPADEVAYYQRRVHERTTDKLESDGFVTRNTMHDGRYAEYVL